MTSVPTVRRFLAGAGMLALAIAGQLVVRAEHAVSGGVLLIGSAILLALLFRGDAIYSVRLDLRAGSRFTRWDLGALAALVIAAGLSMAGLILLDVREPSAEFWALYLASLGSVVLIPLAIVALEGVRSVHRVDRSVWVWLTAVLLVAALTRLTGLSSLPYGTWYDEAANGLEALRIINEPAYRPVYTDGVNASGHYLYLIVAAFELLGVRTESIRLISALAGVGTVVAAYLAGRELFGRSMGLVLAFLMAVSRWAINFSRLGMYNALTPLFELLTIAFLARALRRNRLADYVLAGSFLGLGFCFYAAFQLFAVALALFLVYLAAVHWRPARDVWIGLLLMVCSALVVVAPIVAYAVERPDSYFARVQNTSLLARAEPAERIPALAQNARKHLLMFNVRGDPNGRHNLPGEPMLDPVVASLFVLGIALALARMRQPLSVLLLLWFMIGLMGGILSLDFEAPQSLRSIAALPVVYILAVVPLFVLHEEWVRGGGRYYPGAALGMIGLLLLPSAFYSLDTYFRRQAQDFASWAAFSTAETLTAAYLNELETGDSAYVISLFDQHPTVRFLAHEAAPYHRLETTASLPVVDSSGGDLVFLFDAERRDLFEEALRVYPGATSEEVGPPFDGPTVLYQVKASMEVRERVRGFTGTYLSEDGHGSVVTQKDPLIDFEWPEDAPLRVPFTAEWSGVLAAESYGPYQFELVAPASARVYVNESSIVELDDGGRAGGGVVLPSGLHQLRVVANSGEGSVRLLWKTPDGESEVVPEWVVFGEPVTNNGLLGRYFANGEWAGQPTVEQIDRGFDKYFHIPSLPRPYTVEWIGKIAIPEDGRYDFGVASNDESVVRINGADVATGSGGGAYGEGTVELDEGLHDIMIRFADRTDHTFLTLYWRPPALEGLSGGARQVVPDELLFPPQGSYERVEMPSLAELEQDFVGSKYLLPVSQPIVAEAVVAGLDQPMGVAVVGDSVAVALPNDGRVVLFGATGEWMRDLAPENADFSEPFDVAADWQGNLYVSDAGSGIVHVFGPNAEGAGALAVDPDVVNRSRGIAVDERGMVWIANTPGGVVVRYDAGDDAVEGHVLTLPVKAHLAAFGEAQPVDVAVTPEGSVYVTDAGVHKLSRYTENGLRLWSIDIPVANTLHSSHLATGPSGSLYVTEPENGSVVEVDEGGAVVHRWKLESQDGGAVKPVGIAVDDVGSIWVTDVEGGRVLRFWPPLPES